MSPTLAPDQLLVRHEPDCGGQTDGPPGPGRPGQGVGLARVRSGNLDSTELARILTAGLRSTDRVGLHGDGVVTAIAGGPPAAEAALGRIVSLRLGDDLDVHVLTETDPDYQQLVSVLPPVPPARSDRSPFEPERRRLHPF